jgi:hypothetical protein
MTGKTTSTARRSNHPNKRARKNSRICDHDRRCLTSCLGAESTQPRCSVACDGIGAPVSNFGGHKVFSRPATPPQASMPTAEPHSATTEPLSTVRSHFTGGGATALSFASQDLFCGARGCPPPCWDGPQKGVLAYLYARARIRRGGYR